MELFWIKILRPNIYRRLLRVGRIRSLPWIARENYYAWRRIEKAFKKNFKE